MGHGHETTVYNEHNQLAGRVYPPAPKVIFTQNMNTINRPIVLAPYRGIDHKNEHDRRTGRVTTPVRIHT